MICVRIDLPTQIEWVLFCVAPFLLPLEASDQNSIRENGKNYCNAMQLKFTNMCYFRPAMIKVTLRLYFDCTYKIKKTILKVFLMVSTFRNMTGFYKKDC